MDPISTGGARGLTGTLVMGVLNATPDSFSDGGKFSDPSAAQDGVAAMTGADWIDVGGESTRPGSSPVSEAEQIARVVPVIERIRRKVATPISVDTTRAAVAGAAIRAGATMVNDVSAGRDDPRLLDLVASAGASVVLMHMQGTPATMQLDPRYDDVVAEVSAFLVDRVDAAVAAGIRRDRIWVDPGFGFGKTVEHNLRLLRATAHFAGIGRLLVGTSRKGFIGAVTGEPLSGGRLAGTLATVAWAVSHGAGMVRVHDVAAAKAVIEMTTRLRGRD